MRRAAFALLVVLWAGNASAQVVPRSGWGPLPFWISCATVNALGKFTNPSVIGCATLTDDGTTLAWTGGVFNWRSGSGGAATRYLHDTGSNPNTTDLNLFFGSNAGNLTVTGRPNMCFGANCLFAVTSGNFNSGFGTTVLAALTTGTYNTAMGNHGLSLLQDGNRNTAVGLGVMESLVHGNDNTGVGFYAGVTLGTLGATITDNTFLGSYAGRLIDSATASQVVGNTILGSGAAYSATIIDNSLIAGYNAAYTDVAGNAVTTGASKLTLLGALSGPSVPSGTTLTNAGAIGYLSKVATSNRTAIGNASTTDVLLGSETTGHVGIGRSSGSTLIKAATTVAGQPTAALAGAGAGNVDNGTHVYAVTFLTAAGETACSTASASVNVADKTVNGKVLVTAWTDSPWKMGVTGVNVYRSKAGTTTPLYLIATSPMIANNTSSATGYTDNVADASLTATTCPTVTTAFDSRATISQAGGMTLPGWGVVPAIYNTQVGNPIACNPADTGDDTLVTIPTIPAGALNANGMAIRVRAEISTGATGNNKRWGVSFQGGTAVVTPVNAANNIVGTFEAIVRRITATTVHVTVAHTLNNAGMSAGSTNVTVNNLDTTTSTLVVTGRSSSGVANDACVLATTTTIEGAS